jgi:hypothetical protein
VSSRSPFSVYSDNDDLLADPHNIFNRWKNYFSQLLNDPSKINGNNLNIRRETSRHFWNKNREYLKDKIDDLPTRTLETCIEE